MLATPNQRAAGDTQGPGRAIAQDAWPACWPWHRGREGRSDQRGRAAGRHGPSLWTESDARVTPPEADSGAGPPGHGGPALARQDRGGGPAAPRQGTPRLAPDPHCRPGRCPRPGLHVHGPALQSENDRCIRNRGSPDRHPASVIINNLMTGVWIKREFTTPLVWAQWPMWSIAGRLMIEYLGIAPSTYPPQHGYVVPRRDERRTVECDTVGPMPLLKNIRYVRG
jgi:hypothetical protein